MDLVFILLGVVLTVFGARQKDSTGSRTGLGITLLVIGIVLLAVGVLWFSSGFIGGFMQGFNQGLSES